MLANYEKRYFENGERVWAGRYKGLKNMLHWHFECEIIHICKGNAQIRINNETFNAKTGDCFFCQQKQLHYINGEPDSIIDIIIFDDSLVCDLIQNEMLCSSLLSTDYSVSKHLEAIVSEKIGKKKFYREIIDNNIRAIVIDIFRNELTCPLQPTDNNYYELINKINDEFDYITFNDAVNFSGYTASYFSKLFRRLSGTTFSQYLNYVKVEHAIKLLQEKNKKMPITDISLKCGFTTIRNFNRVFREITGYTPNSIPNNFILNRELKINNIKSFDPTQDNSTLIV